MPLGTRQRLSGLLLASPTGPVLHPDEGGEWQLDMDPNDLLGTRVTIEGIRSGFNRITVERCVRA